MTVGRCFDARQRWVSKDFDPHTNFENEHSRREGRALARAMVADAVRASAAKLLRSEMAKIDAELINTLSTQIELLPQRTKMTPYQVVEQLAPLIAGACERGQDLEAIAKLLKGIGVHLAPVTVGNYLRRARREAARSPVHNPGQPVVMTPVAPSPEPRSTPTPVEDVPPTPRSRRVAATPTGGRFELVEDKKDL
jgi:hypothetical protein